MATIEIIKAETVRRYTHYTVDSDTLTPDQLTYIDCDIYEPIDDDGDPLIDGILTDEATKGPQRHDEADNRAVTYIISELDQSDD